MSVGVQVLSNHFPALARAVPEVRDRAFKAGVTTVIATADPLTRVDTGALRANKTISIGTDEASVTWNQEYSVLQNDGTWKMSGTHFADQGFDAGAPAVQAELARFGL